MTKYNAQESTTLEFKSQLPNNQQIVKTIIAFCNLYGGRLIIGIDDDRDIIGVSESGIDDMLDLLEQSIFNNCKPTILPTIYTQRIDNKVIIIIEVSAGMNKPYFLLSKGLNEGTYIRVGANTVKATPEIIQELQWQSRGHSLDKMPIYQAGVDEIDLDEFRSFLKIQKINFRPNQLDDYIKNYDIIVSEHSRTYPSTAGILLFGKNPQRFLSEAFIICSHFKGIAGREAIAAHDCVGNIFRQLDEAENFVKSRLNKEFSIKGIKRQEKLEIPENALREILINAIVHRNYQIHSPIKIAIYDDRIEIYSPGIFPGPLKPEQLELGLTYIRNRIICRIFREAGYIEKLGSGIPTLFQEYQRYGLPKPSVLEGAGFVKCILPRKPLYVSEKVADYESKLIDLFHIHEQLTVQDVIQSCAISRQTAVRWLNTLIQNKTIKRVGKGPATCYKIVNRP